MTTVVLPAIRDTVDTGRGALIWMQTAEMFATAAIAVQAGSGAFADIARTCGTDLGQSARTIYIDEATSAIQGVSVLLGALALTTLIANRRKTRRYFSRPTS